MPHGDPDLSLPPAQPIQPGAEEDERGFLFDWCLNTLSLVIAALLLWRPHWILWVLGALAVMMLLIRLIGKIRRFLRREPLRHGNLRRPKGTPTGRRLSKDPVDD